MTKKTRFLKQQATIAIVVRRFAWLRGTGLFLRGEVHATSHARWALQKAAYWPPKAADFLHYKNLETTHEVSRNLPLLLKKTVFFVTAFQRCTQKNALPTTTPPCTTRLVHRLPFSTRTDVCLFATQHQSTQMVTMEGHRQQAFKTQNTFLLKYLDLFQNTQKCLCDAQNTPKLTPNGPKRLQNYAKRLSQGCK